MHLPGWGPVYLPVLAFTGAIPGIFVKLETMRHLHLVFLILTALAPLTLRAGEDFEEISYEDLLQELSLKTERVAKPRRDEDFFGKVILHAGFGLINSQMGLDVEDDHFFRRKNGFQLAVGIDLISPEWRLEGAVRNYGQTHTSNEYYSLREFDLKVIHQIPFGRNLGLRFGGGLAARYLNYERSLAQVQSTPKASSGAEGEIPEGGEPSTVPQPGRIRVSNSTPSAIGFVGFDYFTSSSMSFGIDLNARSSLIVDTSDRFALDMTFRIDTHF